MSLHRRRPDRRSLVRQGVPSREEPMHRVRHLAVACSLVSTALFASAAPGPVLAQTTVRAVMHSDLKIVDPIWTTAYITRNHGYMVFDTLLALDADLKIRPQMVDKYTVSKDAMKWSFTLRDG